MPLIRTRLVRLGAVHFVGLAALTFATPAHATDDPPPPVPPAAAPALASGASDEMELALSFAADAGISPLEQESPGNTPPSAPATAQLDRVRQGWSQVISPRYAQKSPERASTDEPQHLAVVAPPDKLQYHSRHVQYQRPATARRSTRAPVLPTASFSSLERTRITRSSSPIASSNRWHNVAQNCPTDPGRNWPSDLPADDVASIQCVADSPADEATSDDPSDSAGCADEGAQYQPDEPQYQTPASTPCGASDESGIPISDPEAQLPEAQVPSTSGSADTPSPPSIVSPTTEPVTAPVPPTAAPAQSGADALPVPDNPQPAVTKVAASRPVDRPSRPRVARSGEATRTQRVIPAQVRPESQSLPARPRPVRVLSPKPKTTVPRSEVEAAPPPPRILEPASSAVNLFGGWLLLVLPLSFAFGLGLLLLTAAIAARSLRARLGSKGLSDHGLGRKSPDGIRYRE